MSYVAISHLPVGAVLPAATVNQLIDNDAQLNTNIAAVSLMTIVVGANGAPISWTSATQDDLGAYSAGTPTFLTIPTTGYYEVYLQSFWSGATGAGSTTATIDRNNSAGSLVEHWASSSSGPGANVGEALNQPLNCYGAGVCTATDRLSFGLAISATGSGGTVITRAVLIRRK